MNTRDSKPDNVLHNANAAAAALDDAADRSRDTAGVIRSAIANPLSKAAAHRGALLPLASRMEQIAGAFSSWAGVVSTATTPMARGNVSMNVLLPRLLEFANAVNDQLAAELRDLAKMRNDLLLQDPTFALTTNNKENNRCSKT
jgi:hypothetical protein